MAKLEGFSKVAVIKFDGNYPYYFAIYDDGTDYQVGDMVVLTGSNATTAKIDEIISKKLLLDVVRILRQK